MWDVIVIGAGAAGMMAAAKAGQKGACVLVLDHAEQPGRKILISGGGRCNFTNIKADWRYYRSENPHFCRSALARYRPQDFLALVEAHKISWHEKEDGQLFCDESARQIVTMLETECRAAHVRFQLGCVVRDVAHDGHVFAVETAQGVLQTRAVILATGGLALPKLGATDFSLRIAQRFGLRVVAPAPALVPFCLTEAQPELAGVSLPVTASLMGRKKPCFTGGMVFTHRGGSGPAILQISSWWERGEAVRLNLLPGRDVYEMMRTISQKRPKAHAAALVEALPARLARYLVHGRMDGRPLAEQPAKSVRVLANYVADWTIRPSSTEGYAKAEVMRGGVDTRDLSSQTMEARSVPGLYIVGEAVDVTGWLGGYNFQWAWASGVAAGQAAAERVNV
ncbi:MAG: NAD(P)/FAD-dependent oxidoreductase [Bombella apis]|nr:NAD(P)/FAD-dependent oxidoreductase [Bombella apis]